MTLLDHVQDIAFASLLPSDLLLGTYTGSITIPGTTTTTFPDKMSGSAVIATGINEKTFFAGVFSVDGGTTWTDFNSNVAVTLSGFANLQTQFMYGVSKPNQLTVYADNWNRTSNGTSWTSSAYTFQYKVVLFAKPDQGDVTPQSVIQQRNFSSKLNYQKVFRDSIYNFTFPVGTSTATITHNLGYVPKFRSFIDNNSDPNGPDTAGLIDFGYFVSSFVTYQCYMDTTTIKYYVDNSSGVAPLTGTLYTRIYYDT